jgi:hypothetical protein
MSAHRRGSQASIKSSLVLLSLCLIAAAIFAALDRIPDAPEPTPSPEQTLRAAWRAASDADSFDFSTHVRQTTAPALSLANVGRSSRTDDVRVMGSRTRGLPIGIRLQRRRTADGRRPTRSCLPRYVSRCP